MKDHIINKESLTDIIFENRFKRYGAYLLRKSYNARLITAFITGLSLMLLLISSPLIAAIFSNKGPKPEKKKTEWVITPIEIEKKDEKKIFEAEEQKKQKPAKPNIPKETTKNKPVKGVNYNVKPTDKDSLIKDDLVQDGIQRTGDPKGDTTDTGTIKIVKDDGGGNGIGARDSVHLFVQEMPKPGYDLGKWLASNYAVPACALDNGIQGTVYIEFIVNEQGNITDVVKKNEIGCGCGDRAIETVKRMPAWSPGKQGGQAVKVRFTIPIKIKVRE